MLLRLSRYVRHLEAVQGAVKVADSLLSTLLLVQRPRWVERVVVGLRGLSALAEGVDGRVHLEVARAGRSCWPCYGFLRDGLLPHYRGTFFRDTDWYRVPLPDGRVVDAVLSPTSNKSAREMLYVDGPAEDWQAVVDAAWSGYGPVVDLRGCYDSEPSMSSGPPLLGGAPHPLVAKLAAEVSSGTRSAVLLVGPPGMGKSHVAEQLAARHAGVVAAGANRAPRIIRVTVMANFYQSVSAGLLRIARPDAIIVHDLDTDAPYPASLLRLAEVCVEVGALLVCTANTAAGMQPAALRDGRLGAPVVVDSAPDEVLRAVVGEDAWAQAENDADVLAALRSSPLSLAARARAQVAAGATLRDALGLSPVPVPTSADDASVAVVSTSPAATADATGTAAGTPGRKVSSRRDRRKT